LLKIVDRRQVVLEIIWDGNRGEMVHGSAQFKLRPARLRMMMRAAQSGRLHPITRCDRMRSRLPGRQTR